MSNLERVCRPSYSGDCPERPDCPVSQRLEVRSSLLGQGLSIRRALPHRQRRMIGAWCFLDHAGPLHHGPGEGLAVGPHPHIGLQTFSWMIAGEILHRDSLGCEQILRPGQVNLMTAGRGIVHSEDAVNDQPGSLHLAQLWIALPEAERHRPPGFHHHPDLPRVGVGGFTATVLVGRALGEAAPAAVYSPLVGLDFSAAGAAGAELPLEPDFEYGALVLEGAARVDGNLLDGDALLYLGRGRSGLALACDGPARVLLIGGEPFGEEILQWWNFVARTPEEIRRAAEDWHGGRFGEVRGSPSPPLKAPALDGLRGPV